MSEFLVTIASFFKKVKLHILILSLIATIGVLVFIPTDNIFLRKLNFYFGENAKYVFILSIYLFILLIILIVIELVKIIKQQMSKQNDKKIIEKQYKDGFINGFNKNLNSNEKEIIYQFINHDTNVLKLNSTEYAVITLHQKGIINELPPTVQRRLNNEEYNENSNIIRSEYQCYGECWYSIEKEFYDYIKFFYEKGKILQEFNL